MIRRLVSILSIAAAILAALCLGATVTRAADHRDAPTIDGIPEGDITDIFAFLDPTDTSGGAVVFLMDVNPFSLGAEMSSYHFSSDILYQFHIDNDNDAIDELVLQVEFGPFANGAQTVNVWGPRKPESITATVPQPKGQPDFTGTVGVCFPTANCAGAPSAGVRIEAAQFDDPFVFDVGQFFRINSKADQDVFRGFTSPALGALRGRELHTDGTSGVDAFAGFNVSVIAISVPTKMLLGSAAPILNIWGTTSRTTSSSFNAKGSEHTAKKFFQVDRMGQQLFNTVFGPATMKDMINETVPADDMANYGNLVPNSLTTTDNDGTGNTIAARASLLTAIGVASLPNGAPLLPSGVGGSPIYGNTSAALVRNVVLPDYLRLDTSILPPNDIPTTSTIGAFVNPSGKATLGFQDGRRPADPVGDILLLLARQLLDVQFPPGSGLPGSGAGTRAALNCTTLPQCPDRRVLTVLQGTDYVEPDSDINNFTTSGNDVPLSTSFPFLGKAHPFPGEPGTIDYPPQM
ncbi:MAG: DUF4331 family protein [Candidatus Binatus sp.]